MIPASVRKICCDWADNLDWFRLRVVFDKEPDEAEKELFSVVTSELLSHIEFKKCYEDCIFDPRPIFQLEHLREVLFLRYEEW
jgi:hypothetical protein